MLKAIDHVVIAVNDLTQTIRDYEQLGFTVMIGGEHAHRGSHNALITFQDGSYIELIAFRHEPPVKDNDWWDVLQAGEGLVDYALISDDLPAELQRLAAAGFDITGPMDGGRIRTDGVRVAWRIGRVRADGTTRLPFLIDDITDRELRVPLGETAVHPNGVIGIDQITIAVASVTAAAARVRSLLGVAEAPDDAARFAVGCHVIQLAEPGASDPGIARFLEQRGSRPSSVTFRRGDKTGASAAEPLDHTLTHSAHLSIV